MEEERTSRSFCREHPKAAADMFARMFKKGGASGSDMPSYENATYEAFKAAFERRGYGDAAPRKAPQRPIQGQQHLYLFKTYLNSARSDSRRVGGTHMASSRRCGLL